MLLSNCFLKLNKVISVSDIFVLHSSFFVLTLICKTFKFDIRLYETLLYTFHLFCDHLEGTLNRHLHHLNVFFHHLGDKGLASSFFYLVSLHCKHEGVGLGRINCKVKWFSVLRLLRIKFVYQRFFISKVCKISTGISILSRT